MANQQVFAELIRHLYEQNRQELYVFALSITGRRDAAEDAIHAAFERLLRRGRAPRELRPYVFRCIRNAAIDELRMRERGGALIAALPDDPPGNGEALEPRLLAEGLARLNDDERECIVMKTYAGLTFREVAAARRVSLNTAASWYRRGIEKLRRILTEELP